jgi:hypothetical protein
LPANFSGFGAPVRLDKGLPADVPISLAIESGSPPSSASIFSAVPDATAL